MDLQRILLALLVVAAASPAPFLLQPQAGDSPAAVPFDDIEQVGLSARTTIQATETDLVIPKAEVYYSRYRYVVGYWGVTSLLARLQTQQQRELGQPLAMYVSDFSGENLSVGGDGYLRMTGNTETEWVAAAEAYYVVNSSARIPTRNATVVPFSDRGDAAAFARQYDGEIKRWDALQGLPVSRVGRSPRNWQQQADRRQSEADAVVAQSRNLLDRPVSVTVQNGSDLQAAVRRAPPNTTIRLEPGTYRTTSLELTKPLTIRGAGPNRTRLVGDGNGTVVTATAAKTALSGITIAGAGNDRSGEGDNVTNLSVPQESWKYDYYKIHGYGDAAVILDEAPRSRVSKVRINTTSSGIIARNSPETVVADLTLYGTKNREDGFLGVSAIGGGLVVQDARFRGGKIGVYSYDAPGLVVRRTDMEGMLVGVLDLFSPRSLITDNRIEDVWNGIYLETRSYGNVIARNFLHNTRNGFVVEGRENFLANNIVVHSVHGTQVEGSTSLYWRNVFAYNRVGASSDSLLPSNRVTRNVFIGNRKYIETQQWNVLHVWRQNYWDGTASPPFDTPGRSFRPTGPVDRFARTTGAPTLARSPATALYRRLQGAVPGLRPAGVVDPEPLSATPDTTRVRVINRYANRTGTHGDADEWDFEA